MMELANRVALVTGGTMGIGAATALALARGGADVAVVARHGGDAAADICNQIAAIGRRCEVIAADIALPDAASRCVRDATDRLGTVSVLVHSAGGPVPGGILEISPDDWYRAFDVHVHAAFHLCRAVLPAMRQRHEGAIVLVSSVSGLRGNMGHFAYQVVKGTLPQFTRALAREFAADNIRVNCVAPGVIRTRFHDTMTAETKRNNLENRVPLRREGTPEQVAELIAALVANDYITGETVPIDGGLAMRLV
jgi:NAD(P)-dependent dehydrogenase (short-subunit alcohol dehydrogenase family)